MSSDIASLIDQRESLGHPDEITESAVETARKQLTRTATQLDLDPSVVERLTHPNKVQEVTVPVERDDDTVDVTTAHWIRPTAGLQPSPLSTMYFSKINTPSLA